ncbi:MAG: outer membrane protein assembly factor BamD [Deltaproteobacteria bacterium]|nr:outer membrane protein assembly factor BamD [Deltaproteobacteria bacterium]
MRRCTAALLCATGALLAGCSTQAPSSADEYYKTASENMRLGSYNQAIETYRALLDEHPFSQYSEEAELKIGVAQYKDKACPEATASFADFQRRHPTSPYLPQVGYLLGQCAEEQMRPSDRDQSASQNAHAYYQAVIQQFPTSPYAQLAREQLMHARETLAGHELTVADYYQSHDNSPAATTRLLDLVNRFNDTDVAGDALLQLGEIYERNGDTDKAMLAFAAVRYHHPDHEAARAAEQALDALRADAGDPPSGDPLAVLRAETGRTRDIAIAQSTRPITSKRASGPPQSGAGSGFGLPGGTAPFGRSSGYGTPGRY